MLLVSSQTAEDHLEWCGLVESKVRYLINNLERNVHISLAHVNPKCFEYSKPLSSSTTTTTTTATATATNANAPAIATDTSAVPPTIDLTDTPSDGKPDEASTASSKQLANEPHCSMWFIGLEFQRTENLNVDLTDSIQQFTNSVHKHAVS